MLKDLMHSLIGGSAAQGISTSQLTAAMTKSAARMAPKAASSKRVFYGNIEVLHVSNGFVVNIGTKEGYEYETHIARTIVEVNEIIAAAMVAFQLENS